MNKYQTYYIEGGIKYKSKIIEAHTREIAQMMCNSFEPYLILGEEIVYIK